MYSQTSKEIKKKLAAKYGITLDQVQELLQVYWDHLVEIMEMGDKKTKTFYNKRIPYLGIFAVKEGRKKYL